MSHPDDRSGHTVPTLKSLGIAGEAHAVGRIQRLERAVADARLEAESWKSNAEMALTDRDAALRALSDVTTERDEWKRNFEVANAKDHEAIAADRAVERALGRAEAEGTKWISVEDRVPGDDTTMIVHTHTGVTAAGFWDGLGWYEPECHSFASMGENVTHWMPFPEPPK